jgi:hypothetical protein
MNFGEFISYCTLAGYVTEHKEVQRADCDADGDAEKYHVMRLKGRGYEATINYASNSNGVAIVNCKLFDFNGDGVRLITQANLRDIKIALIPG